MLLRRRPAPSANAFYQGVPVVNLLNVESKRSFAAFAAPSWTIIARLVLVALMIGGAVLNVLSLQETDRYERLEQTADSRALIANADIEEALALTQEIDALKARGSSSQADFDFLKAEPAALVAAISSAVAVEVDGVTVLSVETTGTSSVTVRILVDSPYQAIEWRRLIAGSPGVERVVSFGPAEDNLLIYEAQIISGGG